LIQECINISRLSAFKSNFLTFIKIISWCNIGLLCGLYGVGALVGVGGNTPGIIKYPFWRETAENPKAVYTCINLGEAS